MIVIPILTAIAQHALIGAGLGALFSGGIAGVGTAVSGVQEHGTFNGEVASVTLQSAAEGAAEGALVGGAFGAVSAVAAPIVPVVLQPVLGVVDDVAKPALGVVDDAAKPVVDVVRRAAKPVLDAVDDIAGKAFASVGAAASSIANGVGRTLSAPSRMVNAAWNGRNFQTLPKDFCIKGCLYVMDDAANAISKIGVTTNPARRIADVQRQVGSKLNYAGIQPVDDAFAAESALHRHFVSQNIRHPNHLQGTEWFNLSGLDKASVFAR